LKLIAGLGLYLVKPAGKGPFSVVLVIHVSKFHEASLNSVGTSFGKEYLGFINDKT